MGSHAAHFGKKSEGHADETGLTRLERIARSSLYDLITFYDALEAEMSLMMKNRVSVGGSLSTGLYDKMVVVKEKYMLVMQGFSENNPGNERLALIKFADTVQDLMAYIHLKRETLSLEFTRKAGKAWRSAYGDLQNMDHLQVVCNQATQCGDLYSLTQAIRENHGSSNL